MLRRFQNRADAGRQLAKKLAAYTGRPDVLVLALPRGGVPVAFEVARALDLPLDVCVVRKLGVPGRKELAMGAVASGGAWVLNENMIEGLGIPGHVIRDVAERELHELRRREHLYRADRPAIDVHRRTVILVDDGIATGSTMRAAVAALRRLGPARLIVAVPTAPPSARGEFGHLVDEMICLIEPDPFCAVGVWYDDFSQTTDDEARDLLERAAAAGPDTDSICISSSTPASQVSQSRSEDPAGVFLARPAEANRTA
jgi:putative phosphoribosyl transferase